MTKKLKKITFSLATSSALFLLASSITLSKSYTSGFQIVGEIWEPYQYPNKHGVPKGYAIEVVEKLLKQANFPSQKVQFYPWERAYKKAQTEKNILILSISRIPEREDLFIWVGKINSQFFQFYALKTNTKINPVTSIEELIDYTVVVSKNSALDKYLTKINFPNVERSLDNNEAYQMLAKERVDLMFKAPSAREPEVKFDGYSNSDLKVIYTPSDSKNDFYLALGKGSSPEFAKKLQKAFEELIDTDVIETLQTNWNLNN